MTDKPPDDEDLVFAVAHALRFDGKKHARSAEAFMAQITAQRIVAAIKSGWTVTKNPPRPLAPSSSLPRMGMHREGDEK